MNGMYDVTIIGCGVVGAGIAYELSHYRLNVAIVEKENDIACGTTKANSAIVHAGYDPVPGTKMARLNREGSEMMEDLCRRLCVEYNRIGSLVLAFNEADLEILRELFRRGNQNGVEELQLLTKEQTLQLEPGLNPEIVGALYRRSRQSVGSCNRDGPDCCFKRRKAVSEFTRRTD